MIINRLRKTEFKVFKTTVKIFFGCSAYSLGRECTGSGEKAIIIGWGVSGNSNITLLFSNYITFGCYKTIQPTLSFTLSEKNNHCHLRFGRLMFHQCYTRFNANEHT